MKKKVLIIEDNYYKFFTTKQVLESQLKLDIQVVGANSGKELAESTADMKPDLIMYRPDGGVAELLVKMKKRRSNRRNTEVVLMVMEDLGDDLAKKVQEFVEQYPKRGTNAA